MSVNPNDYRRINVATLLQVARVTIPAGVGTVLAVTENSDRIALVMRTEASADISNDPTAPTAKRFFLQDTDPPLIFSSILHGHMSMGPWYVVRGVGTFIFTYIESLRLTK